MTWSVSAERSRMISASRIRGVIFDLDGTLCDTLGDIAYAVNISLEALGLPTHPKERYAGWVGWGLKRLCQTAVGPDHSDVLDRLCERATFEYGKFPMERSSIYPGISELLDELTHRGIPFGVVSNKPHDFAVKIIEEMYARWTFVGVEGYLDESRRKPNPIAVLDLARRMDRVPAEVALMGDSEVDIETAHNAGMIAIGVTWGFRGPDELTKADRIIQHPLEMMDVIGK